MKTEVTLKLPVVLRANDYHEFRDFQDKLTDIGVKLKYHEIEIPGHPYYAAIFYKNKLSKKDKADIISKYLDLQS